MANRKNYVESEVVSILNRKNDIRVDQNSKKIQELTHGKGDVGNGTKGKIDFLVKYCDYIHSYVSRFS